jgi:hypothetical protein
VGREGNHVGVCDCGDRRNRSVVRYEWPTLEAAWRKNDTPRAILAETADEAPRPLVFVASGTYASYPLPCPDKPDCRQVLGGADENEHDGELP